MHKIITRFVFTIILAITCQIEIFSQSSVKSQLLSYVPPVVIRYTKSTYHSLPNIDRQTLTHGASATLQYGADNWKAIVLGTVGVAGAWAIYKMGYNAGCSHSKKQSKANNTPITVTVDKQHPQIKELRNFGTKVFRAFFGSKTQPTDE